MFIASDVIYRFIIFTFAFYNTLRNNTNTKRILIHYKMYRKILVIYFFFLIYLNDQPILTGGASGECD